MRILLINPPRENELLGNNPAIIDEERGHNPQSSPQQPKVG